MNKVIIALLFALSFASCDKEKEKVKTENCNIQQVYDQNAQKVTITTGVWGTIANMEGNCMPVVGPGSTCKTCAVQRTVKIYEYTLRSNATASANSTIFFDSFNTRLVAQVDTDANGFFQVNIPAGQYSITVVENGKLYANETDGQGGLQPFTVGTGTVKANLTMTYKAVF
jgi:hypothetical protein